MTFRNVHHHYHVYVNNYPDASTHSLSYMSIYFMVCDMTFMLNLQINSILFILHCQMHVFLW